MSDLPGAHLISPDGKSCVKIDHERVLEVLSSTAPVRTADGKNAFYTKDGWYLLTETPERTQEILDAQAKDNKA
ncbi:hypothetical protein V865_001526 [Kwoniella europaea PYCC6329]|uniref:Uncharacterized protein n=1 Tax=Kwoniella europaea PYCC6329 TaxID=1423913 RepID=A0AAX4KBD3_9TREE